MKFCNICPAECNADKTKHLGRCRAGEKIVVSRAMPHFFEEPCISGENGSGTVFFSGCNLRCIYCQNAVISQNIKGTQLSSEQLADVFKRLEQTGVHNINLVTPTHFTPQIVRALEIYGKRLPVLWNSSGYEKVETLQMLDGLVDIYLPDMKYGENELGKKYSGVSDYFEVCKAAVDEMFRQTGRYKIGEDGLLKSGVIIRHMMLPDAFENTRNVLDYVSERFSKGDILFSLMGQYTPMGNFQEFPPLSRKLTSNEYEWAKNYMCSCGIFDGYTQDISSAENIYIPDFNEKGLL